MCPLICKNKCLRDEFFIDRPHTKDGYNNNTCYHKLTKYCSTCERYVPFKNEDEYNDIVFCPCCRGKFRTRPYQIKYKRNYEKRIQVVRYAY